MDREKRATGHSAGRGGHLSSTLEARAPARFSWPVRVYYEDTDAGGVVYYANYLKFMERARTEWLRALGFELSDLAHEHNVVFVVRSLMIDYLLPARFNEELDVAVELALVRGSQIEVAQAITRSSQTLVTANVRLACVNTRSFRPARIPGHILEKLR